MYIISGHGAVCSLVMYNRFISPFMTARNGEDAVCNAAGRIGKKVDDEHP